MTRENVYIDSVTAEIAYVVKALCDEYNCSQSEFKQFTWLSLWDSKDIERKVKYIRQIPVKVVIPPYMACSEEIRRTHDRPAFASSCCLDITVAPNPSLYDYRELGLHEFVMKTESRDVTFWRFTTSRYGNDMSGAKLIMHFVKQNDLRLFYKTMLRWQEEIAPAVIPVLNPADLKDIYDNTIGFLEEEAIHREKYKEFNIPCKRGILLSGRPGVGKTMTCKWLRHLCIEKGYAYKIVTYEDYRMAQSHGSLNHLFQLGEKGIIFFDDMDILFQDRDKGGNTHLQTFLTQLDGIEPTNGIVFVFTSNRIGDDLDKSFVRPGRVDLFILFESPDENLRRRFVMERFHPELLELIDVEDIVLRTGKENDDNETYSFAEIEEVRKLLSIDLIKRQKVDVDRTFAIFEKHRKDFAEQSKFGFGKLSEEPEHSIYDEVELLPFMPSPNFMPSRHQ